jgi:hypothetical protein
MKRYAVLFLGTLLVGVALVGLGRMRHPASRPQAPAAVAGTREITVEIGPEGAVPASAAVPEGVHVKLRVRNRNPSPIRLALAGYEDRLGVMTLGPGEVRESEFLADRPGEDFAWLVDGEPRGRFQVTGPHLIEGHQ